MFQQKLEKISNIKTQKHSGVQFVTPNLKLIKLPMLQRIYVQNIIIISTNFETLVR